MRAYVAACVVGLFATDEKGKQIAHRLFTKDVERIAEIGRAHV